MHRTASNVTELSDKTAVTGPALRRNPRRVRPRYAVNQRRCPLLSYVASIHMKLIGDIVRVTIERFDQSSVESHAQRDFLKSRR